MGPPAPQGGYGAPPVEGGMQQQQFPGQQYLNDPMANMAMQYGATLADTGKDAMEKQVRGLHDWKQFTISQELW